MKIKDISYFRIFYKENVRLIKDSIRDEHFIGHSISINGSTIFGFFELYHADKSDIDKFITPFLDMAIDAQAVYEFLQNAYDAKAKTFALIYNDKYLAAFNDGEQFSFEGVRSILNIGQSTKESRSNIGKFGVGFKIIHRLLGETNGKAELKNLKGPVIFSWARNEDLLSFLNLNNNDNIEKIVPEFTNSNGSFISTDLNPWLFKILLTNFPVSISDKIKNLNYEEIDSALSMSELIDFSNFLCSHLFNSSMLNPGDYHTGSIILVELGAGKSRRLEDDSNLKGLTYSLSLLNSISNVQSNQLQKIYLKSIENLISPANLEFIAFNFNKDDALLELEIKEEDKDIPDVIEFLVGVPSQLNDTELKNNPNFYLYFPIGDELHEYNFLVHCNFFHNLSQRTSLDKGKRNEALLKYLSVKLIDKFQAVISNNDKVLYAKFFSAVLLSNWQPQPRNKWIYDIFLNPLINFIKQNIPTAVNTFVNNSSVRIKGTKLNISPSDFGVQSYHWFFSEDEILTKNAKDSAKLNIKLSNIVDLIADSEEISKINDWIQSNYDNLSLLFKELDSELQPILSSPSPRQEKFFTNFFELKLFKFSDDNYYSITDVQNSNHLMFIDEHLEINDLLNHINIKTFLINPYFVSLRSLISIKNEYLSNESKFYDFFCSRVASLELKVFRENVIEILNYFNKSEHAVFNKLVFCPCENDCFVIKHKNDSLQHYFLSENKTLLDSYIQENFRTILIPLDDDLYTLIKNKDGILKDKDIYEYLLQNETNLEKLIDVIAEADSIAIQKKYLTKLTILELQEDIDYTLNSFEHKVVSLALNLQFEDLRDKIKINSKSGSRFYLKNINYSEKVIFNFQEKKYELTLSKILPKLQNTVGLADKIVRQFVDIDIDKDKLTKLFGLGNIKSNDEIFSELEVELINSHQLAFVFLYYFNFNTSSKPNISRFFIKDINQNNRNLTIGSYYIKKSAFISQSYILSEIYSDIEDILELNNDNFYLGDDKLKIALEPYFIDDCYCCAPLVSDFKDNENAKNVFFTDLAQKFNNLKIPIESITYDKNIQQGQANISAFQYLFGFDPNIIILNEDYALAESNEILPEWIKKKIEEDPVTFNRKFLSALGMNDENSDIVRLRKAFKGNLDIDNILINKLSDQQKGYITRTLKWLSKNNEFIPLESNRYKYLKNIYSILNQKINYLPILTLSSSNEVGIKIRLIDSNDTFYMISLESFKEFLEAGKDTLQKIIESVKSPILFLDAVNNISLEQFKNKQELKPIYKLVTSNSQELISNYYRIWKKQNSVSTCIYKVFLDILNYKLFANDYDLLTIKKDKKIDCDESGNIYFIGDESNLEELLHIIFNNEEFVNKKFNLLFDCKRNEPEEIKKLYDKEFDKLPTNYFDNLKFDESDFPPGEDKSFEEKLLELISKSSSKWAGYIYHFTHIENAAKIIQNEKILSRAKAEFKDSAGCSFISSTHNEIKNYARFYFRPHTPTQYYNEFFGKRTKPGDLPQCPVPIFFVFSLKEVLNKYKGNCYVSNGNLRHYPQTSIGNDIAFLKKFDYKNLYYDINDCDTYTFLSASQQEFVIKNEFDFSNIQDVLIICPDEKAKNTLTKLIGKDNKYYSKINVDYSYYKYDNPYLEINEDENILKFFVHGYIQSNSKLKAIITYNSNDSDNNKLEIVTLPNLLTISNSIITNLFVYYMNDDTNTEWLVYAK